jgi:hypothetical protein
MVPNKTSGTGDKYTIAGCHAEIPLPEIVAAGKQQK